MKELKDLLKTNKYLEAKALILSNMDKIEECIDDLLGELVDREPVKFGLSEKIDRRQHELFEMWRKEIKPGQVSVTIAGIPIVGAKNIPKDSIGFVSKAKGLVSGIINIGDEHNIVDPKGVDSSYLKAQYDTQDEKIGTLIKKAISNKVDDDHRELLSSGERKEKFWKYLGCPPKL